MITNTESVESKGCTHRILHDSSAEVEPLEVLNCFFHLSFVLVQLSQTECHVSFFLDISCLNTSLSSHLHIKELIECTLLLRLLLHGDRRSPAPFRANQVDKSLRWLDLDHLCEEWTSLVIASFWIKLLHDDSYYITMRFNLFRSIVLNDKSSIRSLSGLFQLLAEILELRLVDLWKRFIEFFIVGVLQEVVGFLDEHLSFHKWTLIEAWALCC